MKRHLCLTLAMLAISLSALSTPASAEGEQDPAWLAVKSKILKKDMTGECEAAFNLIWPYAKKGNKDALATLMRFAYGIGLNMPGRSIDTVSRWRDYYILSVYAYHENLDHASKELLGSFIKELKYSDKFFDCHINNGLQCESIFFKNELLPSLSQYTNEIDIFINAGNRATCMGTGSMDTPLH